MSFDPALHLGQGMSWRARPQTALTSTRVGARLIGAVGRASVGFGLAVGRSRAIRPTVDVTDVNSMALRPPRHFWREPIVDLSDGGDEAESTRSAAVARRSEGGPTARRSPSRSRRAERTRPTWTDQVIQRSAIGYTTPVAGAPLGSAPPGFAPSGDAKVDEMRLRLLAAGGVRGESQAGSGPTGSATSRPTAVPLERTIDDRSANASAAPRGSDRPERRGDTAGGPGTGPGTFARSLRPEPVAGRHGLTGTGAESSAAARDGTGAIRRRPGPARPASRSERQRQRLDDLRTALLERGLLGPEAAPAPQTPAPNRSAPVDRLSAGPDRQRPQPAEAGSAHDVRPDTPRQPSYASPEALRRSAGRRPDPADGPTPGPGMRGDDGPGRSGSNRKLGEGVSRAGVTARPGRVVTTGSDRSADVDRASSAPRGDGSAVGWSTAAVPGDDLPTLDNDAAGTGVSGGSRLGASSAERVATVRPAAATSALRRAQRLVAAGVATPEFGRRLGEFDRAPTIDRTEPAAAPTTRPATATTTGSAITPPMAGPGTKPSAATASTTSTSAAPTTQRTMTPRTMTPRTMTPRTMAPHDAAPAPAPASTIATSAAATTHTTVASDDAALDARPVRRSPTTARPRLLPVGAVAAPSPDTVIRRVTLPRALSRGHRPVAPISSTLDLAIRPGRPSLDVSSRTQDRTTGSGDDSPRIRSRQAGRDPGSTIPASIGGPLGDADARHDVVDLASTMRLGETATASIRGTERRAPRAGDLPADDSPTVLRRALRPAEPAGPANDVAGKTQPQRPADQLADRFLGELSTTIRRSPAPLPIPYQPMATAIVGRRAVRLSTDETSRRALRSVGKVAATTGSTIHLDPAAVPSAQLDHVVAHELTHVAHPSARPRFFDDLDDSPEERRAERVAAVMARSPLAPTANLARPAAARRDAADTAIVRPPASAEDTRSASALADRLRSGSPTVVRRSPSSPTPRRDPVVTPSPTRSSPAMIRRLVEDSTQSTAPNATITTNSTQNPTAQNTTTQSGQSASQPFGSTEAGDAWFQAQLEANIAPLLRLIEDRMIVELERRGGRSWRTS
jgi:antigen KI-67